MKTTIDLPDDLVREAKLRAVAQRRPLKDLMADFIRQGLGHPPQSAAPQLATAGRVSLAADGLPLVRCSAAAPARQARVADLLALEQQATTEDDLRHARPPV